MKKKYLMVIIFLISILLISISVFAETKPFERFTGMYLKKDTVKLGEYVYVDLYMLNRNIDTTIVATFYNETTQHSFEIPLQGNKTNSPYFILPENIKLGNKYEITQIKISDKNGLITYTTNESLHSDSTPYTNCLGKKYITVIGETPELVNLRLKSKSEVKLGEKLSFDLEINGEANFVTAVIRNESVENSFALLPILNRNSNTPEIDLSKIGTQNIIPGKYYISDIFINPDDSSKYVHYSLNPQDEKTEKLNYDIRFTIVSDELVLEDIELVGNNVVKSNDKIYFNVKTSGKIKYISLVFRHKNGGLKYPAIGYLKMTNDGSPMELNLANMSEKISDGEYYLSSVNLFGEQGSYSTTYNINSPYSVSNSGKCLNAQVEFTVKNEEIVESSSIVDENIDVGVDIPKFKLKKFEFKNNKVKLGEKIYFDLETVGNVEKIFLSFSNDKNKVIEFSIYDLDTQNPYITIPEDFDLGKYELRYIVLRDYEENEVHYEYEAIEKNNFIAEIEIEEKDEKVDDTSEENELVVNKSEKINNENDLEKIEIKNYKDVIIKVCVIIGCVVILMLIFTKKILSNKKKENKEE